MTLGWTQMGACILEIHNSKYETYTLTYITAIHCIQCYRHVLVYLIQLCSYINSLRTVSHRCTICTNVHLLVDPNVTYDHPLLKQKLPNNNIGLS